MSEVKRYTFDEICESQDFNHEETFILASDYEHLKAQLERAESYLQIYADENNWANLTSVIIQGSYISKSNLIVDDYGDYNLHNVKCQGERAREYFKEMEQV